MKTTRTRRNGPVRGSESEPSIFWTPPEGAILRKLTEVSRRLRESDVRSRRLTIEGAELSPAEYIARLKKRKQFLIRQAKRNLAEKIKVPPATRGFSLVHRVSSQAAAESSYSFAYGKAIRQEGRIPPIAGALMQAQQATASCPMIERRAAANTTYLSQYIGELENGSTYGFAADETQLDTLGLSLTRAYLNDDAEWYRNDTPDFFLCGYVLEWTLPTAPCDMWVICNIDVQHKIDYHNAADDGGWARTGVAAQVTDENGAWLPIHLHDSTITFDALGSSSWDVRNYMSDVTTGTSTSDRLLIGQAFPINAGMIPGFRLAHYVELIAQDGLVEVVGQFRTNEHDVYPSGPILWYAMIPR